MLASVAATLGALPRSRAVDAAIARAAASVAASSATAATAAAAAALPSLSPVPADTAVPADKVLRIAELLAGGNALIITGAGISTASGIPDYRSPGRPEYKPMQHHEFMGSAATRQRYWARSFVGYPRLSLAKPTATHTGLAHLAKRHGAITGVVTQNVDGLHIEAGSPNVLELHGSIHHVVCTDCGHQTTRQALQRELRDLNQGWSPPEAAASDKPTQYAHQQRPDGDVELAEQDRARLAPNTGTGAAMPRPDGDAELERSVYEAFKVADCSVCGGMLKPDVVFFGGSIDRFVVDQSLRYAHECSSIIAIGTTLTTYSSFRLARAAHVEGKPVAVVNYGSGRADSMADVLVEADAAAVVSAAIAALEQ